MATASVTASQGAIGGSIGLKSGPMNARVWPIVIGNNGPGMASGAEVTSLALQQTRGTACYSGYRFRDACFGRRYRRKSHGAGERSNRFQQLHGRRLVQSHSRTLG